jgi:hypothetical protein
MAAGICIIEVMRRQSGVAKGELLMGMVTR